MTDDRVLVANAADSTISTFAVRGDRLSLLAVSPLPGPCSTFAVDPERRLVYAYTKGERAGVRTLVVGDDGVLTMVAASECTIPMAYLHLTPDGTLLLGASYHGGLGRVWPVADGVLGEPTADIRFANVHCVQTAGADAYFVSLGEDLVAQYHLDAAGRLTPLDPPVVACPPGSGPRHLVVSPDGASAYLVTEFSGDVFRLARDASGRLSLAESASIADADAGLTHSRFGADPRAEHLIWGGDLALAGRRVFATERTAGTIAGIKLDAEGRLGALESLRTTEPQPRGIAVNGAGDRVLVTGELSTTVTLYAVAADGVLDELDRADTGHGANWARFWSNAS